MNKKAEFTKQELKQNEKDFARIYELQENCKKCNHKKEAITNEQGNTIGSYCSDCDIFFNPKGNAISCR